MPISRILLFDLDGTLVDSAQTIASALSKLRMSRGGEGVDVALVRQWVSLGVERLVSNALGAFALQPDDDVALFRAILGAMTTSVEALFPGVADVLGRLASQGHAMGIVTNKPEHLAKALLKDVDLDNLFDVVVGGDTAGRPKPHRAPLDLALSVLGGRACDAVFIGDSDVDAAAARNTGMPFVFFDGGYGPPPSDPTAIDRRFATFNALPGALAPV